MPNKLLLFSKSPQTVSVDSNPAFRATTLSFLLYTYIATLFSFFNNIITLE